MAGFVLCEPTTLYNILNQETKHSRLAEPNYLYLLDVRTKREYDESHIITAQRMKQELDAFEPYPIEIVPGEVYLGTFRQACSSQIHKHLKVKAHVNVCLETTPFFEGDEKKLLHIQVTDSPEQDLFSHFRHASHFMDAHVHLGSVVLVFSTQGISRSCTVILAYLMHRNRESLKRSWAHVQSCKNNIRPNRGFVQQLVEWEKVIHGAAVTDISDPLY
ncbi:serine/threonine/tyrosine-interacting-like protein 1 isoform X2 [Trichosurus vulpecula]|uniref:serine/threonine/tyrosine-interacting-like protein 1 isoform X2 n=1 Tax=Trichosurus vulpecula TaxID=9337 RepID=UPI00186AD97C|nr:serine/threonine/tyrosine-interacting-like protein 1 isoform X2 [Trichosurus vulpecula]